MTDALREQLIQLGCHADIDHVYPIDTVVYIVVTSIYGARAGVDVGERVIDGIMFRKRSVVYRLRNDHSYNRTFPSNQIYGTFEEAQAEVNRIRSKWS